MIKTPRVHETMPDFKLEPGRYVADGYPVEAGFWWVGYQAGSDGERANDQPAQYREVFSPPYASWRPDADGRWGSYTDTLGPFPTKKDAEEAARRPHGDPELKLRLAARSHSWHGGYVLTDWLGHSFEGKLRLVSKRTDRYVGGRYVGPYSVWYWRYELDGRVYSGRNAGPDMALRMRAPRAP